MVRPALGLPLFLCGWQSSCAKYPSHARYCGGNRARPAACPLAHTARPSPRRRARSAHVNGRPCIGSGHGLDCARYAEFGRCQICAKRLRTNQKCHHAFYPSLDHRQNINCWNLSFQDPNCVNIMCSYPYKMIRYPYCSAP